MNTLYGVAATSPDDFWAVGDRGEYSSVDLHVMIQRWNGDEWSLLPVNNIGTLRGVSVVAPNDVWAAGYYRDNIDRTMTMHWDGTDWSTIPSPSPSELGTGNHLYGIDAAGPNDVWAVGDSAEQALVMRWDGTQWNIVPIPALERSVLYGVTVVSANDVWAVGSWGLYNRHTLTLHWDGASWTQVASPNPSTYSNALQAVSAVASNDVWAAGWSTSGGSVYDAVILHWDGNEWAVSSVDGLETGGSGRLFGITAISSTEAWAVGWNLDLSIRRNVILAWNGGTWTTWHSPNPSSHFNELFAVELSQPGEAWAVGLIARPSSGVYDQQILHYGPGCGTATPSPTGSPATATSTRTPTSTRTATNTPVVTPTQCAIATLNGSLVSGDPDFVRPREFTQGGTCTVGSLHNYDVYELFQGSPGLVTVSTCGTTWDTFLVMYQAPGGVQIPNFVPDACTLAVAADDDTCGLQSVVSANLSAGYFYVVVTEFSSPGGAYTLQVRGNGGCSTATPAPATSTPVNTPANTPAATSTAAAVTGTPSTPTLGPTHTPTEVAPTGIVATSTPSVEASPTASACAAEFADVPASSPFYSQIMCLACMGMVGGYPDGMFYPNNNVTRGQLSKMVANTAGLDGVPDRESFEDVAAGSTFYMYVERMTMKQVINGYPCGGAGEPCDPENRPYFRPGAFTTRGQISKIVSNAAGFTDPVAGQLFADVDESNPFYNEVMRLASRGVMSGYPCGGVNPQTGQPEPCDSNNRPYLRWGNNVTRGQAAKIAANTFYPGCQMRGNSR